MAPRTTRDGLNLIKTFEGEKLKAYRCPAGVLTIGVGHTSAAGPPRVFEGMTITPQESDAIFLVDIDRFEDQVEALLSKGDIEVTPWEFDALVSLAFNIGIGAFRTSSVYRRLMRGDKTGAAAAFLKWTKARVGGELKDLPGLVRRRNAEKLLFEGEITRALEKAMYAAGAPIARKVARPAPPKTMALSKTGNAAATVGAGGAIVAVEAAREAVHQAQAARESAQSAGELFGVSGPTALLLGIGILIVVAAIFIWFDRRKKLREDLV